MLEIASTSGPAAQALPVGRYRIDPTRTTIRFSTRHLFGLGGVTGTFRLRDAELNIAEPATATTLLATLDATSLDTGSPKRDADVRSSKYLETATYPDITFTCHQLRWHGDAWAAAGAVTAHGATAPVDVTLIEFTHEGGNLTMRASARIDRYAHQVTNGKGMAARWLTVEITALATLQTPKAMDR